MFGGIHATLYPGRSAHLGGAHAVVKGDGERAWPRSLADCVRGTPSRVYEGGRVERRRVPAGAAGICCRQGSTCGRSVQTVRGCPKHCSFCSVWRTDGQRPRQRGVNSVIEEIVELRRRGFRFIALADDNFYPVTLEDLRMAERRQDKTRLDDAARRTRAERFTLMARLAQLPVRHDVLHPDHHGGGRGSGIPRCDAPRPHQRGARRRRAVTPEGLKDVYKEFNAAGEALVAAAAARFSDHGVHVLGSFIFGLPSDRPETFDATLEVAKRAGLTFAQFVMLTPFPGTIDFADVGKGDGDRSDQDRRRPADAPLADPAGAPAEGLHRRTRRCPRTKSGRGRRARGTASTACRRSGSDRGACSSLKARLAFVLISKIYRQMYANTGIATDSARVGRSARWARWMAKPCQRLFAARPMPHLEAPL